MLELSQISLNMTKYFRWLVDFRNVLTNTELHCSCKCMAVNMACFCAFGGSVIVFWLYVKAHYIKEK